MSREWKPGEVAVADGCRMMRTTEGWLYASPGPMVTYTHAEGQSADRVTSLARPLAVIDPEDREQVERLLRLFFGHLRNGDAEYVIKVGGIESMQAALREFADPKPPRPEEPTGLGAVVEDGDGVRWVRSREDKPGLLGAVWENSAGLSHSPWTGIDVVRVLSEGVQQ